jgi:hypothetical protein
MSSTVLSRVRLVVWTDQEATRSELYATLSIEGWHTDAVFPEDITEFGNEIARSVSGTLVVVVDDDGVQAQKLVSKLFDLEYDPGQILLGCPKNSFTHRLLGRHKLELFKYEVLRTPTGPKIEVGEVVPSLLRAWKNVSGLLLDKEVAEAVSSGILACLKLMTGLNSTGTPKERAHLAHAMAEQISNDHGFRQRVIRLALFADLTRVSGRSEIIAERRALWPIKDLLDYHSTLQGSEVLWSKEMPLEVAIVKIVQLFQEASESGSSAQFISRELTNLTSGMRLENRVALQNAFSATIARISVRKLHAV